MNSPASLWGAAINRLYLLSRCHSSFERQGTKGLLCYTLIQTAKHHAWQTVDSHVLWNKRTHGCSDSCLSMLLSACGSQHTSVLGRWWRWSLRKPRRLVGGIFDLQICKYLHSGILWLDFFFSDLIFLMVGMGGLGTTLMRFLLKITVCQIFMIGWIRVNDSGFLCVPERVCICALLLLRVMPHLSSSVLGKPHLVAEPRVELFLPPSFLPLAWWVLLVSVRPVSSLLLPCLGPWCSFRHPAWSLLTLPGQTLCSGLASEVLTLTNLCPFLLYSLAPNQCVILICSVSC